MSLYNLRNPAVKRLMREAEELRNPTEEYCAQPLEDNLFEWHFTLRGPPNTEFEGGIYHGRITLPNDYPMKPPSIILLTPNGRFEINKKICLSISGHHPESWQPSWSIRTALLAIIGFLPTHGNGAIGSLDYTPEERKRLALKSQNWKCPECGYIKGCLKSPEPESSKESDVQKVETVPLSCVNGSTTAETEIPYHQNTHSEETAEIETIETNFIHEQCKNTSNVIFTETADVMNLPDVEGTPENARIIRQRNIAPSQLSAESVQSDNARSMQSSTDRSVHNYGSLIMIWLILVIIFLLIVRRWLFYDYSL
ncbi:ubiquitin-conjugating enzyme E2 J1-like [Argiope bruennichi]|uniref:Ubiquitin-conjugating enzyme E2 J1 like protein n=1 Tax=Argiope bruennichi TaxID=94029 RepID=A0A8T0F0N6_ARGBR|nr:ubiquitin-conjugating enzyme E2 J1-like [Argiope bruennichi]XP_055926995.1 ubiquitin-conjugating enzyme E2 J1-like [Argiope bruennichi]KAF8784657.1 Ubiquitin-conjugating enzyme E2 J1 like protein [Argiope bruennichi]